MGKNKEKKVDNLNIPEGIEKHRLNKIFLVSRSLETLRNMFFLLIAVLVGTYVSKDSSDEALVIGNFEFNQFHLMIVFFVFVIIGIFIGSVISYKRTFWYLTDSDIIFCKGLISKKVTRMPYEKIHAINTSQKLLDRILRIEKISIDSAGGVASGDIAIPSVKVVEADLMIAEIKARMTGTTDMSFCAQPLNPQAALDCHASLAMTDARHCEERSDAAIHAIPTPQAPPTTQTFVSEYRLKAKEILLAGLANGRTLLYLFICITAGYNILNSAGLDDYLIARGESFFESILAKGTPVIIGLVIVILIIAWAISVFAFALRYFGFQIISDSDRLHISRGLLTHVNVQINLPRIQEIHVSSGIIMRMIGYVTVKAEIATSLIKTDESGSNLQGTGVVLHPFLKKSELDGYLAAFVPEYAQRPSELSSLPGAALRRSFFRYIRWTLVFWVLPFVAILCIPKTFPVTYPQFIVNLNALIIAIGIIGFIFFMLTAWFSYKGRAFAIGGGFIAIRKGAYNRQTIFVPRRKIQVAEVNQNPFQRYSKVANIAIQTAANGTSVSNLRDVGIDSADYYLNWVRELPTIRLSR